MNLGGHREFLLAHGFREDSLATSIGLGRWIDPEDFDFSHKIVRKELRHQHQLAEKTANKLTVPVCLARNIERLSELVGLSATDCRILEFVVLINNERFLDEFSDLLGYLSSVKVFNALSKILGIPEREIRAALNAQSILTQSGLVSVERSGTNYLRSKLDVLSGDFADHICSSDADPVSLLRNTVSASSAPHLSLNDYEHVERELSVLKPYLRKSIETSRVGVNIFIYGAPGTGKSQLAKILAQEFGCELFEVASENEDGDPVNGERRLRAFRAAQNFFAKRKSLILFDEVEDIFNDGDGFYGMKSTAQTRKAWTNRILEESPVPTLWLSNSAQCLDQAFIRRFDMVIELPVPPKKQRQRIINEYCSGFLSKKAINKISESESLAPAVVTRAASVVSSIQDELGVDGVSTAFELIINNTLETQGHNPIRRNEPNRLPEVYDPAYIHADTDIHQVAEGLVKTKAGRLCLYGAPGTGKTAYGKWISEQIGAPLIVKRASDLVSKWVGETEKNIARAFKEAEVEKAVLLIDEVDSFLQDRQGAERGWEVSQVNEMLTQMESFSGVFIASTNLMTCLDQASLRRFDLKIKFDYLKPEQSWRLLTQQCKNLGISVPSKTLKSTLNILNNLTPGDFATVARRHRFQPFISAVDVVSALDAECVLKQNSKRPIGFV